MVPDKISSLNRVMKIYIVIHSMVDFNIWLDSKLYYSTFRIISGYLQ